ncbi:PAS domain-containing hybrid sensor histidine kinase/response regulator [Solidesulfovibrio sp.]|uniref:PAS domain-containing hybrid sensor histidine kinase/response regulator n=1 Tax=Solidesulfovibrio sp. TaxID=2910990 RepID=UPI002B1ECF4B|nr:ATP-binding protein [Solidesulfovibrio sp.]MEA4857808.1 ATP-binding protein [Solidesulfovibrio sp.]
MPPRREGWGLGVSRGWIDLHLYAMATAAVLTGALLWWTNASWRENLAVYPPLRGELRQCRSDIIKAYLAVERYRAGSAPAMPAEADAYLEQALAAVGAVIAGQGQFAAGRFTSGEEAQSVAANLETYRQAIVRFGELLRQPPSGAGDSPELLDVERHAAFAGLEKLGDSLDNTFEKRLAAATNRQDRLSQLLFYVWLTFLAVLAVTLSLAGARRRRAEAALLESEGRYRLLFEQFVDVIMLVDEDTQRILDCNPAVALEWGYAREEVVGQKLSTFRLENVEAGLPAPAWFDRADGRRVANREMRLVTRHGAIRDVSVKSAFFNLDGRRVRLELHRDVTERKKGETALAEREAMLRGLGDNLPEGVIYKIEVQPDGSRRFLYVSRGVERLFGVAADEALRDAGSVFVRFEPEDLQGLRRAEAEALADLVVFNVQARFRGADGAARWGQLRAAPRRTPEGGVVFDGILVDVTEHKRVEERLRQAMTEAKAASTAKSEFLANISHEVRTPLNGVLGMLQLLETSLLSKEDADHVHTALACGRGLVRVLADILDFSLLEAERLVPRRDDCDIHGLVAEVLEVFSLESDRKGLALVSDVALDVPPQVTTDTARLRQILFNVVGNVVKFTEAGTVRLDVNLASRHERDVHLLFTVTDTGIGIPPDKIEAIFEPFTQLDGSLTRKYGGTGLGLGIVKRLVGLLDGFVTVESGPGRGTQLCFSIRCQPARQRTPATGDETLGGPDATHAVRVLVVEDEAVNRMATVSMLRKMGFAAQAVEDGDEALDALDGAAFDVVLMDIQMPRLSGDEATRRIRRGERPGIDPGIPIIALTAHAMDGDRERYLACGMDDYLSKPVDIAALGRAVARAAGPRPRPDA